MVCLWSQKGNFDVSPSSQKLSIQNDYSNSSHSLLTPMACITYLLSSFLPHLHTSLFTPPSQSITLLPYLTPPSHSFCSLHLYNHLHKTAILNTCTKDMHKSPLHIDHNALTSIVSFNLPFFQTTRTLYHWIPYYALISNSQSFCVISDGDSRTRSSKCRHHAILSPTNSPVQCGLIRSRSRALCLFQGGDDTESGY